MRVKALKNFQSVILSMEENEEKELKLDSSILDNWIDSGLIEEVKKVRKKSVKTDDN